MTPLSSIERVLSEFTTRFLERLHGSVRSPLLKLLEEVLDQEGDAGALRGFGLSLAAGEFCQFQVPSLLESLGANSSQGVLLLCPGDTDQVAHSYTLWFQHGALVHGEGGGASGRAAVKACCVLREGYYLYVESPVPLDVPATLPSRKGITFLLLDILREIDEENRFDAAPSSPRRGAEARSLDVCFDAARLGTLVRLVDAVRESILLRERADLDAWYYHQGAEKADRYRDAESRSLTRLYQWLASNGLSSVVSELQGLSSTRERCEQLARVLDALSAGLQASADGDPTGAERCDEAVDWTVLDDSEVMS